MYKKFFLVSLQVDIVETVYILSVRAHQCHAFMCRSLACRHFFNSSENVKWQENRARFTKQTIWEDIMLTKRQKQYTHLPNEYQKLNNTAHIGFREILSTRRAGDIWQWKLSALNTEMKSDGKALFYALLSGPLPSLWKSGSYCALCGQAGNTKSLFFFAVASVSHLILAKIQEPQLLGII